MKKLTSDLNSEQKDNLNTIDFHEFLKIMSAKMVINLNRLLLLIKKF